MIEAKLQHVAAESGLAIDRGAIDRKPIDDWQIFGIGSPHGEDQAGWLLARRAAEALESKQAPRILRTPSELLLCDDLADRAILCDGCLGRLPIGTLRSMRWPDAAIVAERFSGSHDLGLPAVLELLGQLGRLPSQVLLWTVQIGRVIPGTEISPEALASLSTANIRELAQQVFPRG